MKDKINAAIKDMGLKIARDDKHIYRNQETGEMYQGVSTVSNIMPKDWLSAWGAKEAVKALGYSDYEGDTQEAEKMLAKIKGLDVKGYLKLLKESKGASGRKSKKAMVDGKEGHAWLESFVQASINSSSLPQIPTGTPLERPLLQFLVWEVNNVKEWIASEALVCRPDKSYAGQLDAICILKTGELALIDFKFASFIDESYYLQTGGYAACFEPYGILFDKRIIIRLPKTLEQDVWNTKMFKYEKRSNDIEAKIVPTRYDADKEVFFHALQTKGWINHVINLTEKLKK